MPNDIEYHMEQLRTCAAIGGDVLITEVGADEPEVPASALMLAAPERMQPGQRAQMAMALRRVMGAAALPGSSPYAIARHAEALASISAGIVAKTLMQVEAHGGQVRYREAS